MIQIGDKRYDGDNITIIKDKVIIDSKDVTSDLDNKVINITVHGNLDTLVVDNANAIEINGDVNSIRTISGDIDCTGEIHGDVNTTSGDVECGNVGGNIRTNSGDVECDNVGGNVSTVSGKIKHK